MNTKVFGIDFGTSTIKIYRKNEGVIFDKKNIIIIIQLLFLISTKLLFLLCKLDSFAFRDSFFYHQNEWLPNPLKKNSPLCFRLYNSSSIYFISSRNNLKSFDC